MKLIVYSKKDVFPEVVNLDAENAVLTSLFEIFSQNPKSFVECEITISRIKSFEVNNHFLELFFCQRRLLFWQPCRSFPTNNPKKQRKWTFSRENHFIESVSLEGNKAFWTIVPGKIWQKNDKVFWPVSEKRILRYFDKKLFSSTNVTWTRKMQYWQHSGNFCQKLEKVSLRDL